MKKTTLILSLLFALPLWAQTSAEDINKDFDSLGDNRIILEKAKALNPEKEVSIVQDRLVSRRNRFEISPEYAGTFGGDTYTKSQSLGVNVNYHFNPNWSVGARYSYFFNQLTPEGKSLYNRAYQDYQANPNNPTATIPQVDYPKSEAMALVNWYPIYGKMNLFDKAITHFDLYGVLGYGQVELNSGSSPTYTVGGGFGFWHTQHLTTRIEMRYQNYKAQYYTGTKSLDLAIASVQMGWLL
jgi:outer membrane beta-barrel protein